MRNAPPGQIGLRVVDQHVLYFLGVWVLYFFVLAVVPLSSVYGSLSAAVFIDALFVAIVALISTISRTDVTESSLAPKLLAPQLAADIVMIGVALSFIGLAALVYDRIAIQGIRFSEGIAVARIQWQRGGEAREGVSSIFSVFGYACSTSFFVSLGVLLIQFETLPKWLVRISIGLIFVVMMGGSLLAGGRSTILLAAAFVLAFYCIRIEGGGAPIRLSSRGWLLLGALASIAFAYVLYLFFLRASAGNMGPVLYTRSYMDWLGARPDGWMLSLTDNDPVDGIIALIILTLTYFVHSAYILAAILELPKENAIILFSYPLVLMAKIGLIAPIDTNWALAGRFASVPGGLYHDFGPAGLVAGASLLGLGCGMVQQLRRAWSSSVVLIGVAAGLYATLFLSPIVLALDTLSFPFIMLEFILVPVTAYAVATLRRLRTHKSRPLRM